MQIAQPCAPALSDAAPNLASAIEAARAVETAIGRARQAHAAACSGNPDAAVRLAAAHSDFRLTELERLANLHRCELECRAAAGGALPPSPSAQEHSA